MSSTNNMQFLQQPVPCEDNLLDEFMTMERSQCIVSLWHPPTHSQKSISQGRVSIDVSQKSPDQAKCVLLQQCCSEENGAHGRNSIDC